MVRKIPFSYCSLTTGIVLYYKYAERGMSHAVCPVFKQKKKTTGLIWNKAPIPRRKPDVKPGSGAWMEISTWLQKLMNKSSQGILRHSSPRRVPKKHGYCGVWAYYPDPSDGFDAPYGRLSNTALCTKLNISCWPFTCICCTVYWLHIIPNNVLPLTTLS